VAAVLIPLLIMGGIGAASAMTATGAANSTHLTTAPPTPGPGDETPGSDDPSTPPDRNSDQTGVPTPADEIYYIQEGDTLTALSAQFGMSIDSIANYNAVRDVNVISEGAVLRVPFIYVPPVG
jgi:LysM repeat protein